VFLSSYKKNSLSLDFRSFNFLQLDFNKTILEIISLFLVINVIKSVWCSNIVNNEGLKMISRNLLMVFHNSHSRRTVKLFADTCIGLSCKNIIFSKITAAAASIGIPEAQKAVFSAGGNLLFFSDIQDIIETLTPNNIYLLVNRKYGKFPTPFTKIIEELKTNKILVIVGGTSPGLTRKEMDLGDCIFAEEALSNINPIAQTALFLGGLSRALKDSEKIE
jgi:SpoU rRNA methylase family enzyme